MDSEIFRTERSLLNPKFEGYKLHLIHQEEAVSQFPLANRPTQVAISGRVPLIFQEVQSRITHNHLAVHSESSRAVYIDAEYNVILIELDWSSFTPVVRKIYDLPTTVQSDALSTEIHREYPSAAFFGPDSLLVSDGRGTMYVLSLGESIQSEEAILVGQFSLPSSVSGTVGSPFRIHHVLRPSPSYIIATLSSRYYPVPLERPQERHRTTPQFDVWGVKVNLLDVQAIGATVPAEVLWHRRGEDVPLYTTFEEVQKLYLLVGGSEYREIDTPPLPTYEPTPDEIAPIPRAEETSVHSNAPPKPPSYFWTQSSDSVTIAIPLPSATPKDKIIVLFSSTTLTVHVDLDDDTPTSQGVSVPRYSAKKLWDAISPSSSFWTLDREAERTYGILSLHLEKTNEGTRWPQVFTSSGAGSTADEDDDVPETLDPSELWNIREALEKYTAALQGKDPSGLGLGKGVPSLAENEIDEEVDSSVGRKAFITWVPDLPLQTQPDFLHRKEYPAPFQLLSVPIPGQTTDVSLIIKNNIDGAVFTPDKTPQENLKAPSWRHSMTYSALAFVLASKRDTRFTYHIPGKAVMAFESGASNRGGNVYVYYPTDPKVITAKQSVLRVNDGRGALMGVGLFTDGDGKSIIICLTEGDLVLIKGV